jgi:hypothetical protein
MLRGTAPVEELTAFAATLDDFATEPVVLPDAEILQAVFEIRVTGREAALPSGLHPTNPPSFVLQFWRCPSSPWGSFSLAQGRVGCRSGLRPRGFLQGCVCDNEQAADALRRRWGFPARVGRVSLQWRYDAIAASAAVDDACAVSLRAIDPEPLLPGDVSYTSSVVLADTPLGMRLVQIDADAAVERAERVRPRLDTFDAPAWVHRSVDPYYPVSASVARGELTLQRLRYVCKPDELAFGGTETVG